MRRTTKPQEPGRNPEVREELPWSVAVPVPASLFHLVSIGDLVFASP